jgi:hypothetical protein
MRRVRWIIAVVVLVSGTFAVLAWPNDSAIEFKRAQLRVEVNATDGDAGLQIDLDNEPWDSVQLAAPDGRVLLDVRNRGVLRGYGLTELFSESSEPPFTELPLEEFQELFPEGEYVFSGRQIDGTKMRSTFTLTHDFPGGPDIVTPVEDAELGAADLVVEWEPGDNPEGVEIVAYRVLVVSEVDPVRTFAADLSPDTRQLPISAAFLEEPGEYKAEVVAIEAGGNQTVSEVPFFVR